MPYKTILVHIDDSPQCSDRIVYAMEIAKKHQSHLIGAAMIGVATQAHRASNSVHHSADVTKHIDFLQNKAKKAVEDFEEILKRDGGVSYEGRIVDGEAEDGMCIQARYADLVVIGQSEPGESAPMVVPVFPEYVLLHSGRPILIVPNQKTYSTVGKRILLSWNASLVAMRAVTDSIPLLKQADVVHLAIFNASAWSGEYGDQPGDDVALYLARHGVNVEVTLQRTGEPVGAAILALSQELSSDMIVMGGYGHSRARQLLLGGVTRTILTEMDLPVFMSR